MSHTLSLYAKCKVNKQLYRVDLSGEQITLRPISGQAYNFLIVTIQQLRNRNLFQLFPVIHSQVV